MSFKKIKQYNDESRLIDVNAIKYIWLLKYPRKNVVVIPAVNDERETIKLI